LFPKGVFYCQFVLSLGMLIPPTLTAKDQVRIIAPSGIVPSKGIDAAIKTLESWGLKVSLGKNVFNKSSVFAGSDAQRLQDFQEAINEEEVKFILCARGGYGLTRYIDLLNLKALKKSPKWVVGFSDITAFLLKAEKNNIVSIHGPMATSFARKGANKSIDQLHRLLFEGKSVIESTKPQLKIGKAQGRLVGGNLALLCESIGTEAEIDTDNKILIIEDIGEYYYRIDRMLNQLARAKKLDNLKGLVIGSFSNLLRGEVKFTESVIDIIERLTNKANYPIAALMPIGHEPENYPFVHGAEYRLDVAKEFAQLKLMTKLG